MIVDINQTNVHDLIKVIHVTISVAFLVFAIWVITRAIIGLVKHKEYTRLDRFLSYAFIISLYLQVIFGIVLFSNLGIMSGYEYLGGDSSIRMVSKRLWPIEHIVMMIFAVLIASLGLILSINARVTKEKHKKVLIYFSISILLIAQSLIAIYLF
jgi:hypothetical protein